MRAAQTVPGSIHKRKRCLCPQLVISLLANPAGSRPEALEIFWRLKPAIQWLLCRITHHVTEFKKATIGVYQRKWHPTPVLLPGKSHGRRSLVGCSPWGREESDTTERLHSHFSLSCIGEGNGNLLQCSCLENPRDGEAWWAAVYGVAQSRTLLKRLSSRGYKHVTHKHHPNLGCGYSVITRMLKLENDHQRIFAVRKQVRSWVLERELFCAVRFLP